MIMALERPVVTHAPHIRDRETVPGIMKGVLLALVPAIIAATLIFGWISLVLIAVCAAACILTEFFWMLLRYKEAGYIVQDFSAALTGVLLALTLPPTTPIWMAILGSVVAITIGKQIFGGLGFNIFNPALIGRAFLTMSFPVAMTDWVLDGQTTATPLEGAPASYLELFLGNIGGSLGETSALALLLGAAYLLYRQLIDWRLPAGYLGAVLVLALVIGEDPLFHLMAGGLLLGAIFMLTDPVTSPLTRRGRWVYAVAAGILVFMIRVWGDAPGGVLYSILIMNMAVPLLDRFLPDKVFGEVKAK